MFSEQESVKKEMSSIFSGFQREGKRTENGVELS